MAAGATVGREGIGGGGGFSPSPCLGQWGTTTPPSLTPRGGGVHPPSPPRGPGVPQRWMRGWPRGEPPPHRGHCWSQKPSETPQSVPLGTFKRKEKPLFFSHSSEISSVPGKGEIIKPKAAVLPCSAPLLGTEEAGEAPLRCAPLPAPPLRPSRDTHGGKSSTSNIVPA